MKIKLIVIVCVLLLPLVLMWINARSNRKKEKRYEQLALPYIALAFTVAACLLMDMIRGWVNELLNQPFMANVLQWVQSHAVWAFGMDLLMVYIINIGLLVAYLLVKNSSRGILGFCRKITHGLMKLFRLKPKEEKMGDIPADFDRLTGTKKLYWGYLNIFYDIENGSGTVRERWLMTGMILNYAANILGAVYLAVLLFSMIPVLDASGSWYPYSVMQQLMDKLYMWPPVTLLLVKEIAYFLGGKPFEYVLEEGTVEVSEPELKDETDYAGLAEHYAKQFPERYVGTLKAPDYPAQHNPPEVKDPMVQAMLDRLEKERISNNSNISAAVLDCIAALPSRENAVIDTILSAEFGDCLMLYLNVLLARGENLLVLCENEDVCNQVRDYIRDRLKNINLFSAVWTVKSVQEAYGMGDTDVLVLTPQAVLDEHIQAAQENCYRHLTTVLMIDSVRIISEMGNLLTVVSDFINLGKEKPVQYICLCNSTAGELRVTLSQILSPDREFRPFECFKSDETNHILLWNYEGSDQNKNRHAQQNLFSNSMDHVNMGVLLPLAFVGARYEVGNVSLMGSKIPYQELINAIRESYTAMSRYFPDDMTQASLEKRLSFNSIDAENPFVIALDETYNLPMTMRNYCRQIGQKTSMVHIVSKAYMLRDYFAAHAAVYLKDRKKAEMFAPILTDTVRMRVCRMIADMSMEAGLEEETLVRRMQEVDPGVTEIKAAVEACLRIAFGEDQKRNVENLFSLTYTSVFDPQKHEFVRQRRVHLTDARLFKRLVGDIRPAWVQLSEGRRISLGIGQKDIYRYYLPNQAMIVNGNMYYIDAIDDNEGIIYSGRRIGPMKLPVDYYQHRMYRADLTACTEEVVPVDLSAAATENAVAARYSAVLHRHVPVSVETLGFFAPHVASARLDLTDGSCYRRLTPEASKAAFRNMKDASVISLRFEGVDPAVADRAAFTMAVLLSELMKNHFPYTWPCIAVCPVLHSFEMLQNGNMNRNLSALYPQVRAQLAQPLEEDTVQLLLIEDSENDTGMLEALLRNRITPFSATFSLLLDYLRWQEEFKPEKNIRGDYLYFGGEALPDVFDMVTVRKLMEQFERVRPSGIVWVDHTADSNYCYFCHKNLYLTQSVTIMGDDGKKDRIVCKACAQRLLSRKEELIPLYQKTREWLYKTYGVELSKKLKVKFVSASTISKQLKKNRVKGRVVGLAQRLNKTVWVETMSPEENILSTLVHELTHFWQFDHIQMNDLVAVEGHASYMEVQYMKALGQNRHAEYLHGSLQERKDDEYGQGYVWLSEKLKNRANQDPFAFMLEEFDKNKPKDKKKKKDKGKGKDKDNTPVPPPEEEPVGGNEPPPPIGGEGSVPPPIGGEGSVPPPIGGEGSVPPPIMDEDHLPPPIDSNGGNVITTSEVELGEEDVGTVKWTPPV